MSPLKYFICTDNTAIPITDCLDQCPKVDLNTPQGRCLRLPILYAAASDRTWKGKPSTTQLLNPTRLEYLKITNDYAIAPKSRAFALLGTRHHYKLEQVGKQIEGVEVEKYLDGDETGILDLLEPDEFFEGYWIITDYKTWGSNAVAKRLGISKFNGDHDKYHDALQLNNYRLKVEKMGFKVSRLLIQCTVRDGNTKSAYINKINDTMIIIPIELLPDAEVRQYFKDKRSALLDYLKHKTLPPLCPYEERWSGNRCKGYCDVVPFCPEGAMVNKVEYQRI